MTLTATDIRKTLDTDPAKFADLAGAILYEQQKDMMRSIFRYPRVAVCGANGTGKDFTVGLCVLAWLSRYRGRSKAIVTAPTERQVDDIVWGEIRGHESRWLPQDAPLGLRIMPKSPSIDGVNAEHYARGFVTKKQSQGMTVMPTGAGITGYHSPNLLVVISEAHAVDPDTFINIRRFNPRCVLITGNPFASSGDFYDAFHSRTELWHTIHMSAFDTPNLAPEAPDEGWPEFPGMVTKQSVAEAQDEWGEDNPLYQAGILGVFPDNLEGFTVVPLYAARESAERRNSPSGLVVLGVDIADTGLDKTVWVRRQGLHANIVQRYQGVPTNQTEGRLLRYIEDNHVDILVIDAVGVGVGVYNSVRDKLAGSNTRVVRFQGGGKPLDERNFVDRNAECWWAAREWIMKAGGQIPNDPALIGQLAGRSYGHYGDRRVRLQRKEDMAKSPDEADALAMTFAVNDARTRSEVHHTAYSKTWKPRTVDDLVIADGDTDRKSMR